MIVGHSRKFGYRANAVDNGGTVYLTKAADLAGAADSKQFIFSCWFRVDGGDGALRSIMRGGSASANRSAVFKGSGNLLSLLFRTSGDVDALSGDSTGTYTSGAAWHHLLISANLGSTQAWMYVDDVLQTVTATNQTIDWTTTGLALFATVGGSDIFNGAFADLYLALGTFLDLSTTANRRKFISAAGKPVFLGADGSAPKGSQPILYLGNPATSFHTNLGSGGNFTVNGGSLTTASSSPSD